jgi:RND family efflux transporter MFP subunit
VSATLTKDTLTKDTVVIDPGVLEAEPAMPHAIPSDLTREKLEEKPRRPAGRRWLWWGLLAAAVGAGVWLASAWAHEFLADVAGQGASAATGHSTSKASLGFQSEDAGSAAPASFETVRAEIVQRSDSLRLTGTLLADEQSSVASNTSGIVAAVLVDRGSVVRKNDVLVQIDSTDAKNKLVEGQAMLEELKARLGIGDNLQAFDPFDEPEVRLAKASADLAASNLRRAEELHGKKVISAEAYDQTKTEYELASQKYRQALLQIKQAYQVCKTAQAKLAILEKAVADTTIRAPFDGWVAEKLVSVGEQITSGVQATKVLTLVRVDPLRLSLTVPQQSIGCIQPGQTVRFQVDSYPDRAFEGKVRFITPVVSNDTRSMLVEAVVPNRERALRPGLFATAQLELATCKPEVFVPSRAVQRAGEVARVFVVRDGVAREQVVALGEADREKIQIRSGLTGKEILVARPELVHDGVAVRP